MWFLSVLPYNSNTNYYKIITEAVFAKCFAKRLQLYQKKATPREEPEPCQTGPYYYVASRPGSTKILAPPLDLWHMQILFKKSLFGSV
jgi:hypothetical protein